MFKSISKAEAEKIIAEKNGKNDFMILDVRTPEEFSQGKMEGAINIDFYSADFEEKINQLDKNKEYLIYCRSGNRSKSAMAIMKELGFQNVYELDEGFLG